MQYLDLTLATAAENLALDEALLDEAEQSDGSGETLRIWESREPMVVLGRSSRVAEEVHLDTCRRLGIPVLRRTSGGATVVTGPGCLMYAVVLSYRLRPALRVIDHAHCFVMSMMAQALARLEPRVQPQGISDLAVGGRKVSGNSVRCKRGHLLYHGTLLYRFPLELIEQCLKMPPRQPDYRCGRNHEAFVANLPADRAALSQALIQQWQASERRDDWPQSLVTHLVAQRYTSEQWNQ